MKQKHAAIDILWCYIYFKILHTHTETKTGFKCIVYTPSGFRTRKHLDVMKRQKFKRHYFVLIQFSYINIIVQNINKKCSSHWISGLKVGRYDWRLRYRDTHNNHPFNRKICSRKKSLPHLLLIMCYGHLIKLCLKREK